jgi:L-malate glycosyltransferase
MNKSAVKIVLIGPLPPPSGGMANQTEQLARLLQSEGICVQVVQVNAPYRPQWIANIGGVRAIARLLPYLITLWQAAKGAHVFHVMANSGWAWHLFAVPAVWIASLRSVPVVINYRGGGAEDFFSSAFRWVRPTLRRADSIVVPSGFLKAVFEKYGFPTQVVPNIIDLERFSPRFDSEGAVAPTGRPHLVVTRNLEPIYNIETALRAFELIRRQFPQAHMSIAGSGPEKAYLEEEASRLAIADAVTFTGRLDNSQMSLLYRDADITLNPSLVDNMPISVLESLASGVPVVSTNVGGVPFLVRDGVSALLVEPRSPEAMAEAAMLLLADTDKANSLRAAGLDLVRKHTWEAVRGQILCLYEQVSPATRTGWAGQG